MLGNAGGQVCVHLVEYHRRLCEQTGDGEAARFVHQPIAKHIARPHQYRQQRQNPKQRQVSPLWPHTAQLLGNEIARAVGNQCRKQHNAQMQ